MEPNITTWTEQKPIKRCLACKTPLMGHYSLIEDDPKTTWKLCSVCGARLPQEVDKLRGLTSGNRGSLSEMAVHIGNGIQMEFVWVSAGKFIMGSPEHEEGLPYVEVQHSVTIGHGFWMGKYQVTQEQWEHVMGRNPSHFRGARLPVDTVSWRDCQEFILNAWKMKANQSDLIDWAFRLPSEAEWEYSCRAGTTTKYNTGNSEKDLVATGWYDLNSGGTTHEVGQKKPNAWGLYDMHGNVYEWCLDSCDGNNRVSIDTCRDNVVDPICKAGAFRVLRGGAWSRSPSKCRSSFRYSLGPTVLSNYLGLRIVMAR